MIAIFSMTSSLLAFLRGELAPEVLVNPDTRLYFNCAREHVLTPGLVPYEALWRNRVKRQSPADRPGRQDPPTEVPLDLVDDAHQAAVQQFVETVRRADAAGRVTWRARNAEVLAALDPETPCFFGGWQTAADLRPQEADAV